MQKIFISAQQLLEDSFKLGLQIYESGYKPNYIVGVWRGGAPIGIAIQELMQVLGVESDHIAIRTSSYIRIGERSKHVKVHGLTYLVKRLKSTDALLIIDDVYDSGLSIAETIKSLQSACKKNMPALKIATPYFKPENNQTDRSPDYYLHETADWLVFPHELEGLTNQEIRENRPELKNILDRVEDLGKKIGSE